MLLTAISCIWLLLNTYHSSWEFSLVKIAICFLRKAICDYHDTHNHWVDYHETSILGVESHEIHSHRVDCHETNIPWVDCCETNIPWVDCHEIHSHWVDCHKTVLDCHETFLELTAMRQKCFVINCHETQAFLKLTAMIHKHSSSWLPWDTFIYMKTCWVPHLEMSPNGNYRATVPASAL